MGRISGAAGLTYTEDVSVQVEGFAGENGVTRAPRRGIFRPSRSSRILRGTTRQSEQGRRPAEAPARP